MMMPSPMTRRWCLASVCMATMLCSGCQFLGIDRREDISYVTEKERKKVVEPMYSVKVEGTNLYKQWPVRRGLDYGTAPWEKRKNADQPPAEAAIVGPGASEIAAAQAMGAKAGATQPSASRNSAAAGARKPSEYSAPESKTAPVDPKANRHAPGDIDNDSAVLAAAEMGEERPPVWQAQASDIAPERAARTAAGAKKSYSAAEIDALRPPREETEYSGVADQIATAGDAAVDSDAVQASDFEEPAQSNPPTHLARTAVSPHGTAVSALERAPLNWQSAAPTPDAIEPPQRVKVATIGSPVANPTAGVSPGGGLLLMQPSSMGPKAHAVVMASDGSASSAAGASVPSTNPIVKKLATAKRMAATNQGSARQPTVNPYVSGAGAASTTPGREFTAPKAAARTSLAEDLAPPSDGAADEIPDESVAPPARADVARRYADAEPMARAPAEPVGADAAGEEESEGAVVMASDAGGDGDASQAHHRYALPSGRQRQPIVRPDEDAGESHDGGVLSQLEAAKQALPY